MTSVGEDYPRQQARIRQCILDGKEIGPACAFYVAMAEDILRRADEAAISGDIIAQVRSYSEMKEFDE